MVIQYSWYKVTIPPRPILRKEIETTIVATYPGDTEGPPPKIVD